jgi:uncharacterized membrane protein
MLRSRWLSTFTVIGAILIVLGIVGLILGPRFVYDPGQPVTGKEAWCYLVIGILMVMNGVLTPQAEEKANEKADNKTAPRSPGRPSSIASNGTGKAASHDVPVSAEKNE